MAVVVLWASCCCLWCGAVLFRDKGSAGEKMWKQQHRLQEILIQKFFHVNRLGFYGIREIKLLQEHFWLVLWSWQSLLACCDWLGVCSISYHALGLLTGCLVQLCLLIVSFVVLAFACATIALPQVASAYTEPSPLCSTVFCMGRYPAVYQKK